MNNTKIKVWIAVMVIAALLLGCAPVVETPPTVPTEAPDLEQTDPVQTEIPEVIVDENVFYFSNDLEYSRLYSMGLDGTDLKLVLDMYCYDVRQVNDCVFFMVDTDLWVYEIRTGKADILIENVFSYKVDGQDLVYFQDAEEFYLSHMRHRNLATGEDRPVDTIMIAGECDLEDGIVYYSRYDQDTGVGQLCVCDLSTLEVHTIANELTSFYRLQAVEGGVYFEGIEEDFNFAQYFASSDGSVFHTVEADLTDSCQMFHESDGEVMCVYSYYDDTGTHTQIHRHNTDGSITDILRGDDGGYHTLVPLKEDLWLVEYTSYGGWGEVDEYGNFENFVYHVDCFLLNADGTVTELDTTGQMGKVFNKGDFPIMDSSTARKPVTAAIYNLFVANYGYEGHQPLCSTTHGAWLNIADRKADIALLAAPTQEELQYLQERGVEIEMKLYGGDGLVFIGNSANPVNNLTHEQIIAIYRGEITNWSQVGGPDHPITVYYRDEQSGSQRLFEQLVFKGLEIPDFPRMDFALMDEMSTIVDIVISDPYSIGYSIMTYLDDVYENEELKLFAVDGVMPSVESVKDSTYRYHTQGFVVIRSDERADSPARRLYNWFGTSIANELLRSCSVTPLQDGVG